MRCVRRNDDPRAREQRGGHGTEMRCVRRLQELHYVRYFRWTRHGNEVCAQVVAGRNVLRLGWTRHGNEVCAQDVKFSVSLRLLVDTARK